MEVFFPTLMYQLRKQIRLNRIHSYIYGFIDYYIHNENGLVYKTLLYINKTIVSNQKEKNY